MSSMSSVRGHALGATYAASKAFTTSLGEGLWAELQPRGVDVRVCCAGAIMTPNFINSSPIETRHQAMPQAPEAVVATALRSLQARGGGPVVVPGLHNWFADVLLRRILTRAQGVRFMSFNLKRMYGEAGDRRHRRARTPPRSRGRG